MSLAALASTIETLGHAASSAEPRVAALRRVVGEATAAVGALVGAIGQPGASSAPSGSSGAGGSVSSGMSGLAGGVGGIGAPGVSSGDAQAGTGVSGPPGGGSSPEPFPKTGVG